MSDLTIYGDIGWDNSAASVNRALSESAPGPLTVRLNSPGGSVFDGLAIASMLRRRGEVTAVVDGLAASAASIIYISAARRVMAPGSMVMIHNPWSMVGGTSDDMRQEADVLDTIAGEMAKLYADASGGKLTAKDAEKLMDAETWLTAEDAQAIGLCDAIEGKAKAFASIDKNRHAYRNIPKGMETMSTETTEAKPSFLDKFLAKFDGGADARAELVGAKADLETASAALVDAVAKISEATARAEAAEAKASEAVAQIEALKVEHAAELEAAKIQAGQAAVMEVLETSAPEALPHVETVEGAAETHTAKYNALRAQGKYAEAGEYRKAHLNEIFKGE